MTVCPHNKDQNRASAGLPDWAWPAAVGAALAVSAALAGCDSLSTRFVSGLSAEERARAEQIPVYREGLPEASYQTVGSVEGLSCQITVDDAYRVSEENAIEELQRTAFRKGANAVMEVSCGRVDRQQSTRRCFRSIECHGVAVKTSRAGAK